MSREYPYEWVDIPDEELKAEIPHAESQFIRSIPGNVWIAKGYEKIADKIYNFKVRPDDIWIVTYPKCGTTWTQELLWHIVHNVDIAGSKESLFARSPFLEVESIMPEKAREIFVESAPEENKELIKKIFLNSVDYADNLPSPRVIKCHMPVSMLPPELFTTKGCKVVYVCRNPKDTCVSYYHHTKLLHPQFSQTFEEFEQAFMKGTLEYGSYWYHLKDALKYKGHNNFKMVWYEEMKKDLIVVIRDMAKFLGYHLTELKVLTLDDHLYIGNQRKHGSENMSVGIEAMKEVYTKFFRKGQVGDWKNYFEGENLSQWDQWIAKNLEGTVLNMVFE